MAKAFRFKNFFQASKQTNAKAFMLADLAAVLGDKSLLALPVAVPGMDTEGCDALKFRVLLKVAAAAATKTAQLRFYRYYGENAPELALECTVSTSAAAAVTKLPDGTELVGEWYYADELTVDVDGIGGKLNARGSDELPSWWFDLEAAPDVLVDCQCDANVADAIVVYGFISAS